MSLFLSPCLLCLSLTALHHHSISFPYISTTLPLVPHFGPSLLLPFFFTFLSISCSLFYHVSFIVSSSLSYIIQASASHSEIKACACVPSNFKLTAYWKDRQVFVQCFKEAEMPSMTADVWDLQRYLCVIIAFIISLSFSLSSLFFT